MRRPVVVLVMSALALAGAAGSASADACFGVSRAAVCVAPQHLPQVDPQGSSVTECVYVGGEECENVTVPVPTVEFGDGAAVYCKPSCEVSGS